MQTFELPYTKTAEKLLRRAEAIAREFGRGAVGTEHVLLAFFDVPSLPEKVMKQHGITREKTEDALYKLLNEHFVRVPEDDPARRSRKKLPSTPLLELELMDARDIAAETGAEAIGTEHIFTSVITDDGIAAKALFLMNADPLELQESLLDSMGDERYPLEDLLTQPPVNTDTVSKYTRDLTAMAKAGKLEPVIGRKAELRRIMQILCRKTKNNPCLIGEPGVGKTAIVEALALSLVSGKVPALLQNKRLLSLDMAAVVAGTKFRGEFEERMKAIIDEVYAHPEIILFIDEFHTLIGAGSAEGTLDAANILKPALSRGEVQIIGATTVSEYHKHIEKDTALKRRFQSVLVEEPTREETLAVLEGRVRLFEQHHRVSVSQDALTAAVDLSGRYLNDRLWPDKALDLLDEACASAKLDAPSDAPAIVGPELIARTAALWTGIPLEQLSKEEGTRLLELEQELHKRVIGQEDAISALARSVRRSRVGLKDPKRPIGSFLFLGPTGVGKTELTKALAVCLFGDEKSLIRIDMSEYMEKHSVSKIIGSPPGYVGFEEGGQLSEKVRRHPYSVVLFDEIEKAHPDVFHILLQILDEGRLTDAQGNAVDFRNTVIIMTSNAGAERIVEPKKLGFSSADNEAADYERMKSNVMEEVNHIFRPEFINRIDEILVFHALGKGEIETILKLQISDLEKRIAEKHPLSLTFTPEAMQYLVNKGYQPRFGARPIKRLLQTELEDLLASELLSGRLHDNDTVEVDTKDGRITVRAL